MIDCKNYKEVKPALFSALLWCSSIHLMPSEGGLFIFTPGTYRLYVKNSLISNDSRNSERHKQDATTIRYQKGKEEAHHDLLWPFCCRTCKIEQTVWVKERARRRIPAMVAAVCQGVLQ